jgi:ribosomal protein S18 acetylase RimI-like enzyme
MSIRLLIPADAAELKQLRLASILDSPTAFGTNYDEELKMPISTLEARLSAKPDRGIFGAFVHDRLVATTGIGRENLQQMAHKMFVWGMYVSPEARGRGIARALLQQAVSMAQSVPEIQQMNLCVNVNNVAAIRLYESVGFSTYCREPAALCINGELHEVVHMYLRFKKDSALG